VALVRLSRRQFLRGAGAVAVSGVAVSGVAAASHLDTQPEHVTIEYDQARLEKHRARLDLDSEDDDLLIGQYGWVATSPEYDTDALVYWCKYEEQAGATPYDSHDGDHEPYYVFVDSDTGAFRELIGSIYHWSRGRTTNPETDADDHPKLRVINPWHHYTSTEESGDLYEVQDLTEHIEAWLANGLEEDLEPGLVHNPWRLKGPSGRTHWWADDVGEICVPVAGCVSIDISLTAVRVRIAREFGRREAGSL